MVILKQLTTLFVSVSLIGGQASAKTVGVTKALDLTDVAGIATTWQSLVFVFDASGKNQTARDLEKLLNQIKIPLVSSTGLRFSGKTVRAGKHAYRLSGRTIASKGRTYKYQQNKRLQQNMAAAYKSFKPATKKTSRLDSPLIERATAQAPQRVEDLPEMFPSDANESDAVLLAGILGALVMLILAGMVSSAAAPLALIGAGIVLTAGVIASLWRGSADREGRQRNSEIQKHLAQVTKTIDCSEENSIGWIHQGQQVRFSKNGKRWDKRFKVTPTNFLEESPFSEISRRHLAKALAKFQESCQNDRDAFNQKLGTIATNLDSEKPTATLSPETAR